MGAYVTQIGPDGSGHDRCGAAVVASCLLSAGWDSDPWELLLQITRDIWGGAEPDGATSGALAAVLERYGFAARTWVRWPEATAALTAGVDVLCLLNNRYLRPRAYPPGDAWNALHWIRLRALLDDGSYGFVYDPLCYIPQADGTIYQGPTAVDIGSLRTAIQQTPYEVAGLLVAKLDNG